MAHSSLNSISPLWKRYFYDISPDIPAGGSSVALREIFKVKIV
jgi:hypothetical protein